MIKNAPCGLQTSLWHFNPDFNLKTIDEQILRATKEIVVKFIEMGRISPANIHESFRGIYQTVEATVKKMPDGSSEEPAHKD
jgi:hypothetical protein